MRSRTALPGGTLFSLIIGITFGILAIAVWRVKYYLLEKKNLDNSEFFSQNRLEVRRLLFTAPHTKRANLY